ncbi:MAG: glycosyltransferase, partial [Desulfobacteraceae bacterium]
HSWGDHLAKGFTVVTVSQYWRNRLIRRGFHPERIRVIPVGAETEDWPRLDPEEAKRKLGLTDRLVLYTSPFRLNKGILQVLQAVRLLKDRFPEILVLTTGVTDRRTQEQVRRFLTGHRLQNFFRYDGVVPREAVPWVHYAADITVLASQEEEGWGIFLLEGMLSGKPVVCTPMGAMPELVGDRGIVLKGNSVEDLTRGLEQLLASPEQRQRSGRAGRAFAAGFSYQAAARAHLELFMELLNPS